MTFGDKLKSKKKNVKASSNETYLRNIRRLRKVHHKLPIPESDSKWLTEQKLFKWFDGQQLNVRRHMATAANVALQIYSKESKEWKKRASASMKEFDSERRERKLTDKQKSKMPAKGFDALKSVLSTMKKEYRHILKKDVKNWTFNELLRVQDLVILSMYYDNPLRLDFATLKTKKVDDNCIYKQMKKPKGWYIQLKEYKTSKSLGTKVIKPNVSNQRLLNRFIPATENLTDHGYFLTNRSKNKMTKQVLSKRLMHLTRQRIGKNFSVQLLRILYAMKNRDVIETAKQVSEKLLHSQEQSLQYAKKD